jgi:hypothetical protein
LWSHGIIDAARQAAAPNLAIDPAARSGGNAGETGIVVVAKDCQAILQCMWLFLEFVAPLAA